MAKSPINTRLEKAVALHQAGKFAEAERLYDQILALDRTNPDALNLKGMIASVEGRREEALALFDRVIAKLPDFPEGHFNRGLVLAALGRNDEALQSYLKALALKPTYADARLNAGLLLHTTGRIDEAISSFRLMTQMAPADARGFYNLGVCLEQSLPKTPETERPAVATEARTALTRAAALDPNNADVHLAFANLHSFLGEYKDGIKRLQTALALRPDWSSAWNNLGSQYEAVGERAAAVAAFDRAIALDPHDAAAFVNRGMAYLCIGRLAEGWEGYARRFEDRRFPFVRRDWPWPVWRGEALTGKSILVWSDQGIGDEVLYASMISEIAGKAANCIVECAPRLAPLYRRSFPGLQVVANTPEARRELLGRTFDYHSSVLDLGRWLRPRLSAFPNRSAVLQADAGRRDKLRHKYLAAAPNRRLVGISWRSVTPDMSHQKGQPLVAFLPLLTSEKLTFVNLQYGDVRAEVEALPDRYNSNIIVDPEVDSLSDLDGFAAQVAALDAVVTISNTTAHFAGALGVPTWVCLPRGHKQLWYWFAAGDYSPWYRSIRIQRSAPGAGFIEIKQTLEMLLGPDLP
jgi:tetratricopeptide (TPR) repeat protein